MWELGNTEGWAPKNWCFWTVVEKTVENSLNCKIKPANRKGNQPFEIHWRTDAKAEFPILCPPDENSQLTGKDPDVGKDWRQAETGTTEDEMVGWHRWLDGHEFKQSLGDGEGHRGLACFNPWGHKELDMTEWVNWTELKGYNKILRLSSMFFSKENSITKILFVRKARNYCHLFWKWRKWSYEDYQLLKNT